LRKIMKIIGNTKGTDEKRPEKVLAPGRKRTEEKPKIKGKTWRWLYEKNGIGVFFGGREGRGIVQT